MAGTGLKGNRRALNQALDGTPADQIPAQWGTLKPLIVQWWESYKVWERQDTFNKAFSDQRMTVRSFSNDFDKELHKKIDTRIFSVEKSRIYADKNRTELSAQSQETHYNQIRTQGYWQDRGLDSSKFSDSSNFLTREEKYRNGLHDLSASLLDPRKAIDLQLFSAGDGVHLSFVPLSKEDDQQMIWRLTGLAKALQAQLAEFYFLIRGYRAKMTRIKLAREYDIGTGFVATPAADSGQGPHYKLKYGLGTTIKERGRLTPRKLSLEEQRQLQVSLRVQALKFKQILAQSTAPSDKKSVNEIVIALRKHRGPFPVYAVLCQDRNVLECFTIEGGKKVPNGRFIDLKSGVMT